MAWNCSDGTGEARLLQRLCPGHEAGLGAGGTDEFQKNFLPLSTHYGLKP